METPIFEDKLRTLDESRKWIVQAYDELRAAQTELYDTIQVLDHLISEHKQMYDYAHDKTLSEKEREQSFNNTLELRKEMNETVYNWFEKNIKIMF